MPIQFEKKFECYDDEATYLQVDLQINNHTDLIYINLFKDEVFESMSVALTKSDIEELILDLTILKNKMQQ